MATEHSASLALAVRPIRSVVARPHRRTAGPIAALAVVASAASSTLVLPLSLFGVIVVAGVLGMLVITARATPVRRAFAELAACRARQARRDARERLLHPASFGHETLAEMTRLADMIEASDPELARRMDLEALLDRHVALTLAHERALRAVGMADRLQLERMRDGFRADPGASSRRVELCERRLRCLDECEARAERIADELGVLADVLRLISQRVACPDDPIPDDLVERRLAEIDADDAARGLVAAELR